MASHADQAAGKATLKHKLAVITGGASGIGLNVAEGILERGGSVVLTDIRSTPESDALIEIYGTDRVSYADMDVSNADQVKQVIDAIAAKHHGRIDFLISNAGIQIQRPFEDQTVGTQADGRRGTFETLIGINLMGKVYCAHAALPYMKQHGGKIINTSSVHGHVGSDERGPYCAAMHGTEGFTKSLAADVAQYGIQVNSIAPAFIETPLAMGPLEMLVEKGRFANLDEAVTWRLQYQNNAWVSMDDVVSTYCDILDGSLKIATGASVTDDAMTKGYIESATANGGMAIFEDKAQNGVDELNGNGEGIAQSA